MVEYQDTGPYSTRYRYDNLGRLVRACDALAGECTLESGDPRHSTEVVYDSLSRKVQLADPDSGTWTYRYDGSGRLLQQTDARGVTRTIDYDPVYGRPMAEDRDGDLLADLAYLYGDQFVTPPPNSLGRLTNVLDAVEVSHEYAYDPPGRPISTTASFLSGGTYASTASYDWLGRKLAVGYADGEEVIRAYDEMGVDRIYSPGEPSRDLPLLGGHERRRPPRHGRAFGAVGDFLGDARGGLTGFVDPVLQDPWVL